MLSRGLAVFFEGQMSKFTHIYENVTPDQINRTHPGMAHWAGTGPEGKTCRECADYCWGGRYLASSGKHAKGELIPAKCRKGTGGKFPHFARACKYFDPNPNPPLAVKTK